MPEIFDNISTKLIDGLVTALQEANAAAFCVGYFHLRGWKELAAEIERLPGQDESSCCRILVGMHRPPQEQMRLLQGLQSPSTIVDGAAQAIRVSSP